jgi:hypothetical protein
MVVPIIWTLALENGFVRAESDLFSNIIININTLELVTFLLNLEEIFHDSEIFFLFILDRYVENVEWGKSFKRLV